MDQNLINKIQKLKKEKNAIILAHYYQPANIQQIADFVGDSYYLSEIARDSKEDVVVMCGVKFMAESAKILSPQKKILMPILDAGCKMADMVDEEGIIKLKEKYKDAYTVCYINSTAKVKSHCDVAVTSSSAIDILKNIESNQIIFLPDKNLGSYISEFFKEKEFILWEGYCKYHNDIKKEDVLKLKKEHKDAKILVHPECTKEIRSLGDYIGSTTGIINYATESEDKDFIICTEEGVLYELNKRNPNKNFFIPGGKISCTDMKKTTLQSLYDTLLNMKNEVIVDEKVAKGALTCLDNMHSLAK
jgi:quinolinate synthase